MQKRKEAQCRCSTSLSFQEQLTGTHHDDILSSGDFPGTSRKEGLADPRRTVATSVYRPSRRNSDGRDLKMLERKGWVSQERCRSVARRYASSKCGFFFHHWSGPRRGVMSGLPLPEWNRIRASRLRKSGHGAGSKGQIDLDKVAELNVKLASDARWRTYTIMEKWRRNCRRNHSWSDFLLCDRQR